MYSRASGILLHITSLPSKYGIGTLGEEAFKFIDFLKETDQTYWQILPLTTTSYGDSPYQSFSAVAGNTNLIDFDILIKEGILENSDVEAVDFGNNCEKIDYGLLFINRRSILEKAVFNFLSDIRNISKLDIFKNNNSSWLFDYAEYMAIKEFFGNKSFLHWPAEIKMAKKEAREYYRSILKDKIDYHIVVQYLFFKQWNDVKSYANINGIKIIGDMPIYVSEDSVEMWLMPELFKTGENNELLYVAGVPADDFSPDGQLWGNPIYDWQNHKETNYAWWVYRVKESFKLYDVLRIDHFKGFSDFWQIDKKEVTAKIGTWEKGPGIELFEVIKEKLGDLPIIAENLGFIDSKAEKLLLDSGYPGMKILQFAFDSDDSLDLPHNYIQNCVAYTGTHDNEVVNGWYEKLSNKEKLKVCNYLSKKENEKITEMMIRGIHSSVSNISIITMQDLLDKPANTRMNIPSTLGGNWQWRMLADDINEKTKIYLKNITNIYGRARKN